MRPKLFPLARTGDPATLATTEQQDRYFLVFANGVRESLSIQRAALLYGEAMTKKGRLLWKKREKIQRRTKERRFAAEAARWEEEAKRLMANLPPVVGEK